MTSTNKKKAAVSAAILLSLSCILTGCTTKEYTFAYDSGNPVSSFRMTENAVAGQADLFAEDLCVAASDVTEGTSVSLEEESCGGLFDLNGCKVIYAKDIHEKRYPASLTKVMTALLALKYGNPEDIITVSSVSAGITESGATLCGLKAGDTLTLEQALNALLIYSANDAGLAIAEHIGGSAEGFAQMMNEEAKALGATNSNFVNPHGLHDENHYVTAYDMYLIFNEAMQYELFREIIHKDVYETTYMDRNGQPKTLDFKSTNQYLQGACQAPENITVIGGKTGTTSAAKSCLILLAEDSSGNPYISVILHASERSVLYEKMTALLSEIKGAGEAD